MNAMQILFHYSTAAPLGLRLRSFGARLWRWWLGFCLDYAKRHREPIHYL
jgi:hypothetical protein